MGSSLPSMRVAWFGAEVPPTEHVATLLIASGTDRFLAANWGEGFALALPEGAAGRFAELVESRGWRVWRVAPPELPPLRFYDVLRAWPVPEDLAPVRGGVVAEVRRGRAMVRVLSAIDRQYLAVASGVLVRLPMPPEVERARESLIVHGATVRAFPFVFDERSSRKFARKVAELKLPRRGSGWFTPLDVERLLARVREGGGYRQRPKIAVMAVREFGLEFSVRLADALALTFSEKQDNSLLLCGAPGTGKSIVLDTLLAAVPASWNVLVLDPTGEHAVLAKFGYRVARAGVEVFLNPLELGPAGAFDVIAGVIEGYWRERVSPIVAEILRRALQASKNLAEAYDRIGELLEKSGREDERNAAAALLRRLEPLLTCPALYGLELLPRGKVVIDMSSIESEEAKTAFALTVLHAVYSSAKLGRWRGVVVVDEADRLGDCEVVNRICDELRKYSVSVWAAGHSLARIARKLTDAKYQLYFATTDLDTLRVIDPRGEVLPRLGFAQALVRERGARERVISLSLNTEVLRSKALFKPGAPLSLTAVAARYGVSPYELAVAFSREACEALLRFLSGAATQEDLAFLDELNLRRGREATKLSEACLELCREAGIC